MICSWTGSRGKYRLYVNPFHLFSSPLTRIFRDSLSTLVRCWREAEFSFVKQPLLRAGRKAQKPAEPLVRSFYADYLLMHYQFKLMYIVREKMHRDFAVKVVL